MGISRLAKNIEGYGDRVQTVSKNTAGIIHYLGNSPAVRDVYSVFRPGSHENFLKIRKHPDALPGLVSVVFDQELSFYYDMVRTREGRE